jgi:hypothetical protein
MQRTRTLGRAAAFGFLIALSAPAAAQYGGSAPPAAPPPSAAPRGDQPASAPTPPAATPLPDVLRAIACAVGRDANLATAVLAAQPRSTDERDKVTGLLRTGQRCLRQREAIATSPMFARGAAAEAIYETQFATPATARTPALGAAPLPRPAPSTEEIVAILAPMYALVDCAMPRAPDLVRALLATEPRSAEEASALTALNPALIACVPAGTTQLNIDPRVMRAFFAEAIYRWSVVQRDGPASPWAAAAPATAAAPSGN